MICPLIHELPDPPSGRLGWPWTVESETILPSSSLPNGEEWPRVSLIIPSFNQGNFLEETIRAILLQGYPDLECIIIDGGSTDETLSITKKYEQWIQYWVSEPDRGQSHAINKGLAICTGKYFNWNNADDVLTPNSLRECVTALEENPTAGGVTGYILTIDEESNILSSNDDHPLLAGKSGFLHDVTRCIARLKCGCQIGGLMDSELVRLIGGIDETIHYAMDADLQLRLMLHKPIYHIDYGVIRFRIHATSKTSSYVGERAIDRIKIANKIFSTGSPLTPEIEKLKFAAFATAYRSAQSFYKEQGHNILALWYQIVGCLYSFANYFVSR